MVKQHKASWLNRPFYLALQLLPTIGGLFPGILRDVAGLTRLTLQHAAVVGGPQVLTGVWACVFGERGGGRRGLRCSMLVGRAVGGGCEGW